MASRAFQFLVRGWRSAGIFLLAFAGAAWFHHVLAAIAPSASWLAWDVLRLWLWQLVLSAACVSAGVAVLAWANLLEGTLWEALAFAFPCGFLLFSVGFYLLGYAGGFVPWVAAAWPLLLMALGARPLWQQLRVRDSQTADPQLSFTSPLARSTQLMLWLGGGAGVCLVYLGAFSPDSVNYDAAWMHLVIAQDYARAGRVVPFYGDWVRSVPHLGSVVHTWDFVVPFLGHTKPLRWMMCLHTEFSVFVWTLVGIAAAVNWIVGRAVRGAWVVMLLFPAILAYDSNMGGAADHILAFICGAACVVGCAGGAKLCVEAMRVVGLPGWRCIACEVAGRVRDCSCGSVLNGVVARACVGGGAPAALSRPQCGASICATRGDARVRSARVRHSRRAELGGSPQSALPLGTRHFRQQPAACGGRRHTGEVFVR